jgi:hypothetical protein
MSRVCRQVHAETRLLAYTVNTFYSIGTVSLTRWLVARLPEQRAAIQRIGVKCGDCLDHPLHLLPGLKSLEVDWPWDVIDDCARGTAMKDLEDTWGNSDLKIQILWILW